MKRKNPIRALMDELRKDKRSRADMSPDEARRRSALTAGFRRLNAWKKRASS
jgi:hypothetical protein